MTKSVFKGSLVLVISGVLCKMLGAFFKIPLTNILGVKGIGLFQMIMSVYAFALILCSGGVTVAVSKLFAEATKRRDESKKRGVYRKSIIVSLCFGLFVGLIILIFADKIAYFQGEDLSVWGYKVMAFLLPLGGIIACFRGVIQGSENMTPTAVSQILEQGAKFLFGLLFAYVLIKHGIQFGVAGAVLGILMGEIFATTYLFFKAKNLTKKVEKPQSDGFFKTLLPIMLTAIIFPFVNAVDSFIIVNRLLTSGLSTENAVELFGIQTGVVSAILNLPLIISTSMATTLLPKISTMEDEELSKNLSFSFKVLWLVVLPMVFGITSISKPLYSFLYQNISNQMLEYAVNLTKLGAVSTIIFAVMQFLITVLQARGSFKYLISVQLLGAFIKVFMTFVLCAIREVNIYGLAIGNIVFGAVVCIGSLIKLRNVINLSYFDLFIPVISSLIMTFCVSYTIKSINYSLIVNLLIFVCVGAVSYIILCLPCLYGVVMEKLGSRNKKEA